MTVDVKSGVIVQSLGISWALFRSLDSSGADCSISSNSGGSAWARVELDNVIALLINEAALLHPGIPPFHPPEQTKLSRGEAVVALGSCCGCCPSGAGFERPH